MLFRSPRLSPSLSLSPFLSLSLSLPLPLPLPLSLPLLVSPSLPLSLSPSLSLSLSLSLPLLVSLPLSVFLSLSYLHFLLHFTNTSREIYSEAEMSCKCYSLHAVTAHHLYALCALYEHRFDAGDTPNVVGCFYKIMAQEPT